jgi:hypothetical protein
MIFSTHCDWWWNLDCPYHARKQAAVLTVAAYWVSKAEKVQARKIMAMVLWDSKGILLVDFITQETTINSESYCETVKKLWRESQNRQHGLLTNEVCLMHDNVRPHNAACTRIVWVSNFLASSIQSLPCL